jgi:hypothetical protein
MVYRFGQRVDVLDEEERWMNYAAGRVLEMLNHEVMWQAIRLKHARF